MPKTKLRNFNLPDKETSFFDSYDLLLKFWVKIDSEFGSLTNFLANQGIDFIWENKNQQDDSFRPEKNDKGLRTDNGDLYKYNESGTWDKFSTIGRLP